jgi:integrase
MAKRRRGNNEGSIYKMQDGRWRAAVSVGKDAHGKPKRQVFTKPTRHEVQDELAKALRDVQLGLPIVSEKQTVGKYLDHWLCQIVKPSVRPKTFRTYSDFVKNHIGPSLGQIPLGKLSPQHVREFVNVKLAIPDAEIAAEIAPAGDARRAGKCLSPATVKHILKMLRGALAVAVKDGQIQRNVAALVAPPTVPKHEMKAFSRTEARAFLAAVEGHRFEAVFTVAVALGMRQGEILGLRWSDVNLETGTLTVRAALQRVEKKLILVEPKSVRSRRSIQLPAVCVAAFARHMRSQEEWKRWAGSKWRETEYVFTTRIGTPVDARDLSREYYQITRPKRKGEGTPAPKLGFPAIRFHDLRHSAATLLLAQGVSPRYITELLGHSQVSFTMQTYAHVLPEVQKETAAKMDEILVAKPAATKVATKRVKRLV